MKNEMIYLFLAHETEKILLTHFLEELGYTVHKPNPFIVPIGKNNR